MALKNFLCACFFAFCGSAFGANFSSASSISGETAHFNVQEIIGFAKKVERRMAENGARVALLARMGRAKAEMPPGMQFTHVGFAVYSEIQTADGRKLTGYAIHNLYQRDKQPQKSELIQDYPVDFFSGVAQLEAAILIPSVELQDRLIKLIASPDYKSLHDPRYSLIANPYTEGRQNCTEFTLDVINAAIYQTNNVKKLKQIAKEFFVAQSVEVNPFKVLLGSIFVPEISTVDQPGKPVTATFERIAEYVLKYDANSKVLKVLPSDL